MTQDVLVERLQSAKSLIHEREMKRAALEGKLESFRADLDKFKESCREQGIDPSRLDAELEAVEKVLDEKLTALETALNGPTEAT